MPTKAEKEGWLPVVRDEKPLVPTFDLNQINVVQMAADLSSMLSRPAPKTWLGQWFRSKSISLDTDRVRKIAEYVESVREANDKITNMQAELVLAPAVLEGLISGHYAEAKRAAELQMRQHKEALQRLDDEAAGRQLQLDRARAEIESLRANTRLTMMQGLLLEKIIGELSLDNITPAQAILLIKALNPHADAQIDYMAQELVVKEQLEKMRIENEKAKAEVKQKHVEVRREETKADVERARANKTINEIKRVFEEE